ncbi:DUF308 domain-containing protein [Carnobacterium maltaromaticum]|uniref:DUF308 domain-containing protein n=1 Tax=Carnobacterium maltaromaticum TaxID=2751 RepID=UPI0007054D75|nr:DUF308 domain-containing protein [Carnobacterium maltaromaticum]KRN85911.1 hypothetical protein IV75_GL001625 [Carnobacterium maltaromaticum]
MFFLLKVIALIFIVYGLFYLYKEIVKNSVRVGRNKKIILSVLFIVVGIIIFPKWSNDDIDAQNWAHTQFNDSYWSAVKTLDDADDIISSNSLMSDDPNSKQRQMYRETMDELGIEYSEKSKKEVNDDYKYVNKQLKDTKQKIKKSKAPWYLNNSIYKEGNKVLNLQIKQINLKIKTSKGYQKNSMKFAAKSWNITKKSAGIDSEIEAILINNNLLDY